MLSVPFLTDLDSRAAIKGTRDALGIQQIWTRMGRQVVGNLSTVSNSVRDFTTTLLGYHFAEVIAKEDPESELPTFLKWEQLAAYVRAYVNSDGGLRGIDRVKKNLAKSTRVTLSADSPFQILSNQKNYGLWGLYSVPSRSSGLLDHSPARLTDEARAAIKRLYLDRLGRAGNDHARTLLDMLRAPKRHVYLDGRDQAVCQMVGRLLPKQIGVSERDFYRSHLVCGGPYDSTSGRQRRMAILLDASLGDPAFAWSPHQVGLFAKQAESRGTDWEPLAETLHEIRTTEQVLVPTSMFFSHLLGMSGVSVQQIVKRLKSAWGPRVSSVNAVAFAQLKSKFAYDNAETGDRWVRIAQQLSCGDYEQLLTTICEQNAAVMKDRGGIPWLDHQEGKLRVRYRDERGILPSRAELPTLWRYPYFLDSLCAVSRACGGSGVSE